MSDLDIEIKLDPAPAVAGARAAADGVAKTEEAAKRAKAMFDSLGQTFRKIAEQQMAEMARLKMVAHGAAQGFAGLASAIRAEAMGAAAKGFDSLTAAIEREQAMLKSIRGPMEQYQQDVQVLAKLHRDGAISADEHAAAIDKAKARSGQGGGGSMFGELGGQLAGVAAPMALLAAGAGAIKEAADEMHRLELETTNAANAVLKFEGTQEKARANMQPYRDLAANLNATLAEGVAAYDAVEGATSRLYLTQKQQMDITRNLGQTIIADGGSLAQLEPILERLEFAIEKGTISGGELGKMMRTMPELGARWRAEFGMTTEQLIKAADSGDLMRMGGERLVTTWLKNEAASKLYTERVVTQEDVVRRYGEGLHNFGRYLKETEEATERAKEATISWGEEMRRNQLRLQGQQDAIQNLLTVQKDVANQILVTNAIATSQKAITDGAAEAEKRHQAAIKAKTEALREQTEVERMRAQIFGGVARPGSNANAWTAEQARRGILDANVTRDEYSAGFGPGVDQTLRDSPSDLGADLSTYDQRIAKQKELNALTKKWHSDMAESNEMSQVLVGQMNSAVSGLTDNLVDAAFGADVAWQDWGENLLKNLAKAVLQATLLKAITGSATGAAGAGVGGGYGGLLAGLGMSAFATGGSAQMTDQGLRRLPGAATGMDAMVAGAGGVDSKIAMLRITPGETLHVRTPDQQRAAAQAGAAPSVNLEVVNQSDQRGAIRALGSTEGRRVFMNMIREDAPAIRRLLGVSR